MIIFSGINLDTVLLFLCLKYQEDEMIDVISDFQITVHPLQCSNDESPIHETDAAEKAKRACQPSPSSEIPLRCR